MCTSVEVENFMFLMILGLWHYPGQSIFEGDNPRGFGEGFWKS